MSEEIERVELKIGGRAFKNWDELEITLALDSCATAAFRAPMEPDRPEFRSTFAPFSFADVSVATNGSQVFSGTMIAVDPQTDPGSRIVTVQAYSKPGVLGDCCMPASSFPLEFAGLNLIAIAKLCCAPFGVEVAPLSPLIQDPPFDRVEFEPDAKPFEFLAELAKQRNLIVRSTTSGALEFHRPLPMGAPVAALVEGRQPLRSVAPSFDAQSYYSEVTGLGSAKIGDRGGSYTEPNSLAPSGLKRPLSFKPEDTESANLREAAKARMGRMLGNCVSYSVDVPTWRNQKGGLWMPGDFVNLKAPGAMVYNPTMLMIREVVLRQSISERSASMSLVMPGSFSGELPERLPWA